LLPEAEQYLASRDGVLRRVIAAQADRWAAAPTEDPIRGLIRIVVAQQVSTAAAGLLFSRMTQRAPFLGTPWPSKLKTVSWPELRKCGLTNRKARCCAYILRSEARIRSHATRNGVGWDTAIASITGVGPWTRTVFRILVLRERDVLAVGDVGLMRAISQHYGPSSDIAELSRRWVPLRSVACWYLWRSLGNEPLG